VTLRDDAPAVGQQVADIGFPRDSSVVAILRSGGVVVPRGDTSLLAGDEVLVLVTDESEPSVRQLLVAAPSNV
jgi:trk system potassium uptake protein